MKQKQYKKTMKTIKELIDLLDMESEMVHGLEEEIEDLNVHIHTLHKHIADLEVENTCLEIEKEVLLHKNRDAFYDALDAAERDGFVPSYSGGVNARVKMYMSTPPV